MLTISCTGLPRRGPGPGLWHTVGPAEASLRGPRPAEPSPPLPCPGAGRLQGVRAELGAQARTELPCGGPGRGAFRRADRWVSGVDSGAGRPVGTQRCAWEVPVPLTRASAMLGPWAFLVTRLASQQWCGQWCGGRRRLLAMSSGQGSGDELQAEGGRQVTRGKTDEPQIPGGRASLGQGAGRRGCGPAGRSREAQYSGLTNMLPFQCLFASEGNRDCNHNEHTMVNSAGSPPSVWQRGHGC